MRIHFETDYLEGWADSSPAKQRVSHVSILFPSISAAARRHEYLAEVLDLLADMGFVTTIDYGWNYRRRGTHYTLKGMLRHPAMGNVPTVHVRILKELKETSTEGLAPPPSSP